MEKRPRLPQSNGVHGRAVQAQLKPTPHNSPVPTFQTGVLRFKGRISLSTARSSGYNVPLQKNAGQCDGCPQQHRCSDADTHIAARPRLKPAAAAS